MPPNRWRPVGDPYRTSPDLFLAQSESQSVGSAPRAIVNSGGTTVSGTIPQEAVPRIAVSQVLNPGEYSGPPDPNRFDEGVLWATHDRWMQQAWMMPEEDRYEVALQMFLAGLYPSSVDLDDVSGQITPLFLNAWNNLFNLSLNARKPDGSPMPWYEVLDQSADPARLQQDGSAQQQSGLMINLSDPVGLASNLKTIYKQVVGYEPTRREQQAFIRVIHEAQRQQQRAQLAIRDGAVVETTAVDVGAQAEQFARQRHPVPAEAREVALAGEALRGLIQ